MALPICSRRPLSLLQRMSLSPNSNILLPRVQRASFADIKQESISHLDLGSPLTGGDSGLIEELQGAVDPETRLNFKSNNDEDIPEPLTKVQPHLRPVLAKARLSKALQAMYLKPLKKKPTHGIVVCDLQLRSFSARNLELFADFAMRAAYYLGLPARGPVALPHITQRYTVIRSNFIHKKSQENFERVHLRRLIQIQDGDPVVVQCWLGYIQKKQYHGVGMKANLYENEALGVGKRMDEQAGLVDQGMDDEWGNLAIRMNAVTAEKVEELLGSEAFSKPRRDLEAFYREPIEVKRKKAS